MIVYRIASARYPNNDGEGARLYGGRWNHRGTPVIYCAGTVSLCTLEILANSAQLPIDMVVISVEIPDSISILSYNEPDLPEGWDAPVPSSVTKDLGTAWFAQRTSLVLSVPSVIVRSERNFLLNPLHGHFGAVRFSSPEPFVFDPRLK